MRKGIRNDAGGYGDFGHVDLPMRPVAAVWTAGMTSSLAFSTNYRKNTMNCMGPQDQF